MSLSFAYRIPRAIIFRSFHVLNKGLHYVEEFVSPPNNAKLHHPPIFIIGAPRSGSTLLFQTIVNRYELTHLTNFHCRFYGGVSFIENLFGPSWKKGEVRKYESRHGVSQGMWAPSECGEFWYRWFRRYPPYTPDGDISEAKLESLRSIIAAFGNAGGRPILFKNMYCAFRLQPLAKIFPEALFIVIHRDPLWTGQSLLAARQEVHGNIHTWWSMQPPEYNQLSILPPAYQVIGQIKAIYNLIEVEKKNLNTENFLHIHYETFCNDVHGELDSIQHFLLKHGVEINVQKLRKVPNNFPILNAIKKSIDKPIFHELEEVSKLSLSEILNYTND